MPLQQRGSDWTDHLSDLLPILIAVIVGGIALLKRGIDALFARRSAEAKAKPKPPLRQEVKRYLDMLDRDSGRSATEPAEDEEAAEEASGRERDFEPAPVLARWSPERAASPALLATAARPEGLAVAPALAVSRPIAGRARAGRLAPRLPPQGRARTAALRDAVLWSEILAPPVAERPPRM